jgi:hypothetical protein
MCPSLAIGSALGSAPWSADAFLAESLASKVSYSVRSQANVLLLAKDLWTLDSKLRKFLKGIYTDAEKRFKSGVKSPPVSEEDIESALQTLRRVSESVEQMYRRAKAAGLTNRRFVGAALNSVHVRGDEILDLVESVELGMNPDVDSVFDKALSDLEHGDTVDFAQLK